MGIFDSLFGSDTVETTSQTDSKVRFPIQFRDLATAVGQMGNELAGRDPNQLIAGFSPDQLASFQALRDLATTDPTQYFSIINQLQQEGLSSGDSAAIQGGLDSLTGLITTSQNDPDVAQAIDSLLQQNNVGDINAEQYRPGVATDTVSADPYSTAAVEDTMSPYRDQVIDKFTSRFNEQADRTRAASARERAGRRAFGSRGDLAETEEDRNLTDAYDDALTKLLESGFTNAQGQFNTNTGVSVDTQKANQAARLQSGLAGQGNALTAEQANQAKALDLAKLGQSGALGAGNLALDRTKTTGSVAESLTGAGLDQSKLKLAGAQAAGDAAGAERATAIGNTGLLGTVGDTYQQQQQKALDAPWTQLDRAAGVLAGVPTTASSTTTGTSPSGAASPLSQLAGAGLAAYGLFNPTGAADGGVVGGLDKDPLSARSVKRMARFADGGKMDRPQSLEDMDPAVLEDILARPNLPPEKRRRVIAALKAQMEGDGYADGGGISQNPYMGASFEDLEAALGDAGLTSERRRQILDAIQDYVATSDGMASGGGIFDRLDSDIAPSNDPAILPRLYLMSLEDLVRLAGDPNLDPRARQDVIDAIAMKTSVTRPDRDLTPYDAENEYSIADELRRGAEDARYRSDDALADGNEGAAGQFLAQSVTAGKDASGHEAQGLYASSGVAPARIEPAVIPVSRGLGKPFMGGDGHSYETTPRGGLDAALFSDSGPRLPPPPATFPPPPGGGTGAAGRQDMLAPSPLGQTLNFTRGGPPTRFPPPPAGGVGSPSPLDNPALIAAATGAPPAAPAARAYGYPGAPDANLSRPWSPVPATIDFSQPGSMIQTAQSLFDAPTSVGAPGASSPVAAPAPAPPSGPSSPQPFGGNGAGAPPFTPPIPQYPPSRGESDAAAATPLDSRDWLSRVMGNPFFQLGIAMMNSTKQGLLPAFGDAAQSVLAQRAAQEEAEYKRSLAERGIAVDEGGLALREAQFAAALAQAQGRGGGGGGGRRRGGGGGGSGGGSGGSTSGGASPTQVKQIEYLTQANIDAGMEPGAAKQLAIAMVYNEDLPGGAAEADPIYFIDEATAAALAEDLDTYGTMQPWEKAVVIDQIRQGINPSAGGFGDFGGQRGGLDFIYPDAGSAAPPPGFVLNP